MALVLADRVLETTTTTGSGTITLAGAKQGYQSFAAVGNGNTTYYTIAGLSEWEVGIGTYTSSGTTLSRDTVLASSSGGTKITFSAGSKDVFVTYPAGRSVESTSATITTLTSTSANITTLTGTNWSATSLTLTNALKVAEGGTGLDSTPTNGQLLIGNGTGFALSTLTAGSGMTITNSAGSITLSAAGLPAVVVTASTAISAVTGNHYVLTATTAATVTLPASPTISDTVWVTVANGLTTNVVARNGKNIQGIAEDMTLNAPYAAAQLRFSDDTEGWILI